MDERQVVALRKAVESAVGPLEDSLWETLIPFAREMRSKKGDHIVRAGDRVQVFGWLLKGLVRRYHVDERGIQITSAFLKEGVPFGPLAELVSGEPSPAYYQCLEDVEAVIVRWEDWQALCLREPRWNRVSRVVSELLLGHMLARESALLSMSSEERYVDFCQRFSDVAARARLGHIASYLGMRPEHLSRIRRKLASA